MRLAVPAWKTSAPARLGVVDALDRRAGVAALRVVAAAAATTVTAASSRAAGYDARELAARGRGDRLEQVGGEARHDHLRLRDRRSGS